MAQISVHNEWAHLEETVLGIASELYFPARHPLESEASMNPWWQRALGAVLYPIVKGRRVPAWITRKYVVELEALRKVLIEHGVTVYRPTPVTPLAEEPPGLWQTFARDPIMAVGNTLVVGQLQIEMRRKELRGFHSLLGKLASCVVSIPSDNIFLEGGTSL